MFTAHPELLNIFNRTNQKNGTQPFAVANTIYLAIENIDHLDILSPQLLLIAHKHRASTVLPEHYPIVGKYLLVAIDEFLGGMGDTNILNAWSVAYNILARMLIDAEKQLYDELGDPAEQGFIPFIIAKKETIASGPIVSFTFERQDGKGLRKYHAGQYITVCMKKGGLQHLRHYSLIQPFDGMHYCIAIKHENERQPKGIVSTELIEKYREGDRVLISLPAGTFGLASDAQQHLFIAGGIGITVLASLILDLAQEGKADSATLIHCVSSENHAAFATQMRSILPHDQYHLLVQSKQHLFGIIERVITPDTHVYLCGSDALMDRIEEYLTQQGHPPSQIHIEAYQPSLSLVKNAVKK